MSLCRTSKLYFARFTPAAAVALLILTGAAAFAAAGMVAWQETTHDGADIAELAAAGKVSVVLTEDELLEARELETGDDMWGFVPDFDQDEGGIAMDMAAAKSLVAVAGRTVTDDEAVRTVRAYDASTGDALWSKSEGPAAGVETYFDIVVTDGKLVVAAGRMGNSMRVLALDGKDGSQRWEFTGAAGTEPSDVSMKGKMVAVVGQNGNDEAMIVLFDAKTGDVQLNTAFVTMNMHESVFTSVAASKKGAVAGGEITLDDIDYAFTAYYSPDGFVWSNLNGTVDGIAGTEDVAIVGKIAVSSGFRLDDFSETYTVGFVRGLDLTDGASLWEIVRGPAFQQNSGEIVAKGNLIVACGSYRDDFDEKNSDVFGIDAKAGEVIWSVPAIPEEVDGGCDHIATAGKTVLFASDGDTPLQVAVGTK